MQGSNLIRTVVETLDSGDRSEEGIVRALDTVARETCRDSDIPFRDIAGIGIGAPGALRHADGVIIKSPNFSQWKDFHLAARLEEMTGVPVSLDNDANVVTLGEALFGAGRNVGDFACMTLGSGVGGGLFLDGHVYRGADGMAGEIGHWVVEPEGFPCGCGGRGCLEQYSAANGLRNMVRKDRVFGDLTDSAIDDPDLPQRLFEAAQSGDARCQGYFDEFGYRLAIAIGGLLNLVNVHTVIIAGGLARAYDAFSPRMLEELPSRGYRTIVEAAKVVTCELWEEGGILGAAALVGGRPESP